MWFAVPTIGTLVLCAAMFYGGGTHYWGPLESDLTNQFFPWRVFIHRWFSRGIFPYWDPHIFSGYPTVESQQMLNMHPLHLLSVFLDPRVGLTVFTALNTFIACVGMLWALRRWCACSPMAAALGAGLYVFGALFAVRVMAGHITVVTALAWWPLAALSVLRMVRQIPAMSGASAWHREKNTLLAAPGYLLSNKRFRRLAAVSALSHAMVCLAGAPQYIVYLFYIDLAILAAVARRDTWAGCLASLAAVWVLALVISAPQWLPALWYLPYTGRATTSGGATGLNLGPMQNFLLELVMPFPFGDDLTYGHLHFKNVWETATYPGGAALVLSLALVVRVIAWRVVRITKKERTAASVTPLAVAAAVILLLGFYMMIGGWLPGFSGFREPLKARALIAFGFAIAAAATFDLAILRGPQWKKSLWIAVIAAALLIGYAGQYTGTQTFKELVKGFGVPMDPLAADDYRQFLANPEDAALRYYVSYVAGQLGVLVVLIVLLARHPRRWLAALFLFWIALGDPFYHHARAWVARHPWDRAGLPAPVVDYFKPLLEDSAGELPWRVVLHSGIINRTHHLEGLYEYYGYDPLMPAQGVTRMLVKGVQNADGIDKLAQRKELLQRVGARYDASHWLPGSGDAADNAPADIIVVPQATLFDVTRKVLAGTPGEQRFGADMKGFHYVVPASQGGLARSVQPSAEFGQYIDQTFPDAAEASSTGTLAPGETVALHSTGRPDEYGVRVSLKSPALVVYKGTWLPGWHIVLDGADAGPAMFANNWMPAAIVPKGDHKIVFRYRPVGFTASLAMAALGMLAILLMIMYNGRKLRS